jgi:hypothetical protein
MLAVFMLSGRMCSIVRCKVTSMAIVPYYQGARGELVCIAMRLTLRKGGRGGTGRSWCIYVMAITVAMLVDIVKEGVVKLFRGSIIVQNYGHR